MSDKHPIDEMFRGGLDGKGLDYDPKYWEQMDSLIASQRRRKYRKALWLSLALLVLVTPIVYFFLPESNSQTAETNPSQKQSQETFSDTPVSNELPIESTQTKVELPKTNTVKPAKTESVITQKTPENSPVIPGKTLPVSPSHPTENRDVSLQSITQASENSSPTVPESGNSIIQRFPAQELAIIATRGFVLHPMRAWNPHTSISCRLKGTSYRLEHEKAAAPSPNPLHFALMPYFEMGAIQHRHAPGIQAWKTTYESVEPYQRFGIDLRMNKGRLGLVLGIGLNQWTERTNYTRDEFEYTLDSSLRLVKREFIQRADGSYIALLETVYDTVGTSRKTVIDCPDCQASFQYIQIPIGLHYRWGRGRLKLLTGAGIDFGFLTWTGGNYSLYQEGESWNTGSDPNAFQKVLFHGRFNIGLSYHLNSVWSIQAQGFYRRSLNSMTNNYQQNPDQLGVRLGIGLRVK